jgi:hypothetical protein
MAIVQGVLLNNQPIIVVAEQRIRDNLVADFAIHVFEDMAPFAVLAGGFVCTAATIKLFDSDTVAARTAFFVGCAVSSIICMGLYRCCRR